jgi:S1-C subfamily serine protease
MRLSPLLIAVFALTIAGCAGNVPKSDYKPINEIPEDASPAPVALKNIELLLPVGADVGFESESSRFCGWPRRPVGRAILRDAIDGRFSRQTFHDALSAQGYDVVGDMDIAFDEEEEIERAEYAIAAKVRDVQLDMCHNEPDNVMIFFTTRGGVNGEMHMTVDWTVYDLLHREVVYKTTTEGYTKHHVPNEEGLALLFSDSFEMAAHNLGADPLFRELIVNGARPEGWEKEKREGRFENRPSKYDPREEVTIHNPPLSITPFSQTAEQERMVAVMPEKIGHGSGFFITKQGHILTNAHVVGDGQRMRLVTADKKHELVAEVLRVDRMRDVALLKLEEIPPGLEIITLPIRTEWPAVGEDAYAIGTPLESRKLQDTINKGIISAHRPAMKFLGTRQNFIQSDVDIHAGNSGGPLIDANGNIVGLAAAGLAGADMTSGLGLNFFVPIGEALDSLNIHLSGDSMAAPSPPAGGEPQKITVE